MGLKQEKVQPRLEGVDPTRIGSDRLYVLKGNQYIPFARADWDDLATARARL